MSASSRPSRSCKRKAQEKITEQYKKPKRKHTNTEKKWPGWTIFKEIFYCGTEWNNYPSLFTNRWDFTNLQKEIEEGKFKGKQVHIFGQSEALYVDDNVVLVPILVVIECDIEPPSKVGICSVQKANESIKNFREMRMNWMPCFASSLTSSKNASSSSSKNGKKVRIQSYSKTATPLFHYLESRKRDAWLSSLKEQQEKEFDYCNPYIFLPHKEQFEGSTDISWFDEINKKTYPFDYDWDMDDYDDRTDDLLKDNNIPKKFRAQVRKSIVKHVTEAKKKYREEKAAFNKKKNSFSANEKKALKNLKLYKFYPKNFKNQTSKYINRYYGHANEVFSGEKK